MDVRRISAAEANAPFRSPIAQAEGWSPPYPEPSGVRTFSTARELDGFVRLHTSASNPAGGFVVRAKEIAHLGDDAMAIRTYVGLKEVPGFMSDVRIPASTRMQAGIIGPQPNFGLTVKSGFQYQLLDRIPVSSFTNTRALRWTPSN